ncbi:S41 family peptidase [Reichenbachiella versicolor]|uniref:S41 family peptidase n=1 Tax=Reichenbachiella versicolor TaxID=1821036 RepID=UPI000D6DFB85|nr:S41 family peptidase [Reichenbachiella versicolor]
MKYLIKNLLGLLVLVTLFTSCSEDESLTAEEIAAQEQLEAEQKQKDLNEDINEWIYDVMDEVYYWTDNLPSYKASTSDPEEYFETLIDSEDRFSYIAPNYDELINGLNGVTKEGGYEFILSRTSSTSEQVVGIITYIKPNSPAETSALKRGDVFIEINDKEMNLDNYSELLGETSEAHTLTVSRWNGSQYAVRGTFSVSTVEYAENPIFMNKVITDGDHKIGYLVYNFFSNGGQGDNYDDQVDAVFGEFNSEGITDLVLDLRYNSGGSISSATNLASLIAPGVTDKSVFYHNQFNDLLEAFFKQENEETRGFFTVEANNIGIERLYIITGRRTASASELMINGLLPYMDITLIGETTVGKNVGSIPIEDTENDENDYGLLPIVLKIANSNGNSDYADGFTPKSENILKEFSDFDYLVKLGDESEPLLSRAIQLITGNATSTRRLDAGRDIEVLPYFAPHEGHLIVD